MCCVIKCALKWILCTVVCVLLIGISLVLLLVFVRKGDNCTLWAWNCCEAQPKRDWIGCAADMPLQQKFYGLLNASNTKFTEYCPASEDKSFHKSMCASAALEKKEYQLFCRLKCRNIAAGKEPVPEGPWPTEDQLKQIRGEDVKTL